MTDTTIFETASRTRLRFDSPKGLLTVEDLWQLPLTHRSAPCLDAIARQVHRELKEQDEVSFVKPKSTVNQTTQLRMDILQHIINVRLEEQEAAKTKAEEKQKAERIKEILARKQEQALEEKSEEELLAMLNGNSLLC